MASHNPGKQGNKVSIMNSTNLLLLLSQIYSNTLYTLKVLIIYMSGGFSVDDFGAVSCQTKRILLFNKNVYLCRLPFHNVVRHLEY